MRSLCLSFTCCLLLVLAGCAGGNGGIAALPASHSPTSNTKASQLAVEASADLKYVLEPLPSGFVPYAIMRNGRIAGSQGVNAAIYYRGRLASLGTYEGGSSVARFVNDRGDAVGTSSCVPFSSYAVHTLFCSRDTAT